MVFIFDSSMRFSRGYFKVINILAEEYPEVQFLSMDFVNDYNINNLFSGSKNITSLCIKMFHKGKWIYKELYRNFYSCIPYHLNIDRVGKFKGGKFNVSKHFDDTKVKFDGCNFVFASSAKEALSYINTKPVVLAFVYDKDDKEYICSEDVLFNFLHDLSFYYRDVSFLLVEKTVANANKKIDDFQYAGRPSIRIFAKGMKVKHWKFESFEKTMRSIMLNAEIELEPKPLKNLYRGNSLFFRI